MNNTWILSQVNTGEQASGITSEPVTGQQNEAITVVPDSNKSVPGQQAQKTSPVPQIILLGLMFVVFYFLLFRGPRKKQEEHKRMVRSLNKNDKVRTIGGIIGTVVDIKDDIITLKVDESNNTKIKIVSSAIGKNLIEETK